MPSRPRHAGLQVGDPVQLLDLSVDAVGTVVELLRGDEHVRVALRGKPQQGATRVVSFPSDDIAAHVREW